MAGLSRPCIPACSCSKAPVDCGHARTGRASTAMMKIQTLMSGACRRRAMARRLLQLPAKASPSRYQTAGSAAAMATTCMLPPACVYMPGLGPSSRSQDPALPSWPGKVAASACCRHDPQQCVMHTLANLMQHQPTPVVLCAVQPPGQCNAGAGAHAWQHQAAGGQCSAVALPRCASRGCCGARLQAGQGQRPPDPQAGL